MYKSSSIRLRSFSPPDAPSSITSKLNRNLELLAKLITFNVVIIRNINKTAFRHKIEIRNFIMKITTVFYNGRKMNQKRVIPLMMRQMIEKDAPELPDFPANGNP